jgi:ribokinase
MQSMKVLYLRAPSGLDRAYPDFVKAISGRYPIEVYEPDRPLAEQFKGVSVVVDPGGAQIARSDVVMSVRAIPVEAAAQAMALGRKHGVRTILNPAPATELDESVLQHVDYLTPNESELRILLGLAPDDPTPTVVLAEELRARGVRNLIVTMGEQGALILTEGAQEAIPGAPVDVVDTTGAGDAFNAGLAVALAEGRSLAAAARYANRCGAIACLKLGVIPALATRSLVEQRFAAG